MTVRNPNPAHKKNILPGLQVPSGLDVELEKYLQAVKEHLQVLQGVLGQPKERAVTLTDLEKAGLATVVVKGGRGEIGSTAAKAGAARAAARQGGATRVRDLSDVDTVGRVDGDLLQYRSTIGKWQRTTVESITSQLAVFDDDNQGVVPASNGGTDNFLRADGQWAAPPGSGGGALVYANTDIPAGNTVEDTGVETVFESSYTIPADTLEQGSVIRIRLAGLYSTDASSAPTLRLRIKLAGDTILDSQGVALSTGASDAGWWIDVQIVVQSVGATGAINAAGVLLIDDGTIQLKSSAPTIDTTADIAVTVSAEWATADEDDSVTLHEMLVYLDSTQDVREGAAPNAATFITADDESSALPNSRKLVAGTNVTLDDSTPGELLISAAGSGGASDAIDIDYDNSTSGLAADNVQDAIDELDATLDLLSTPGAEDVTYDNSTSGLDATDVQAAIDELAAEGGGGGGGSADPLKVYEHFSDMDFADPTLSGIYYDERVSNGLVTHENGQAGRPGIMCVQKSGSSSQANLFWSASPIVLGDGVTEFETEISLDIVNDGGSLRVGLMTGEDGTPAEGVYFRNHVTVNDNKWLAVCQDSVGSATLNSEFAHGAGEWFKLKLVVNADGSEAEFFINGASIGTISTNIPTGVPLRWRWQVWQASGLPTSTMKMFVDWVRVKKTLTTPR